MFAAMPFVAEFVHKLATTEPARPATVQYHRMNSGWQPWELSRWHCRDSTRSHGPTTKRKGGNRLLVGMQRERDLGHSKIRRYASGSLTPTK